MKEAGFEEYYEDSYYEPQEEYCYSDLSEEAVLGDYYV